MSEKEITIGSRVIFRGITGIVIGIGSEKGKTVYMLQAEQDEGTKGFATANELYPAPQVWKDESDALSKVKRFEDLETDKQGKFLILKNRTYGSQN